MNQHLITNKFNWWQLVSILYTISEVEELPSLGGSVDVIGGVKVEEMSVAHPTCELTQLGQIPSAWNSQESNNQHDESP